LNNAQQPDQQTHMNCRTLISANLINRVLPQLHRLLTVHPDVHAWKDNTYTGWNVDTSMAGQHDGWNLDSNG